VDEAASRHALFAYGSLQVEEVMEAVTGRRFKGRPATLPGHRRRLLHGCTYPGVVPDGLESTPGVLFEGLAEADLEILDLFEGEPYARRAEQLEIDGPVRARSTGFVYVVRDECAALMSGAPWDLATFRERSLSTFLEQCRAFRREALRGGRGKRPD
jgi:gamma-glutamylcyclotransferase (GGCT)/AIG2-like uncharacterized protein YtfP